MPKGWRAARTASSEAVKGIPVRKTVDWVAIMALLTPHREFHELIYSCFKNPKFILNVDGQEPGPLKSSRGSGPGSWRTGRALPGLRRKIQSLVPV